MRVICIRDVYVRVIVRIANFLISDLIEQTRMLYSLLRKLQGKYNQERENRKIVWKQSNE